MRFFILLSLINLYILPSIAQQTSPIKQVKNNPYKEHPLKINQFLMLDIEHISFDFDDFSTDFNSKNIELLNKDKLFWGIEYGLKYKRVFGGVTLNIGQQKESISDSIQAKSNFSRIGISSGFYLIDHKNFVCLPRLGFFLNNVDLKNYPSSKTIPLSSYIENPHFDINFRQYTAQFGLDLYYKTERLSLKPGHPFLIGLKFAYNSNLGKTTLKSDFNKISSQNSITINPFSFGIHFTVLL